MEVSVAFLFILCLTVAHGASVGYEMKLMETKNNPGSSNFQATKPSVKSSSSHSVQQDLQMAHLKFQANRLESGARQDDSKQSHMKTPVFPNQDHLATGSPMNQNQPFNVDPNLFQSQQYATSSPITTVQPQIGDFPSQQQFFPDEQEQIPQQQVYQGRSFDDRQDPSREMHYRDISHQDRQIRDEMRPTQSYGISQDRAQLSAFDNREQPIVLPRFSHSRSASVVVSGIKNLPMLPAMVYNAGNAPVVPMTYGRDSWYQGGASVRHHLQTPYVRYVYSHLL